MFIKYDIGVLFKEKKGDTLLSAEPIIVNVKEFDEDSAKQFAIDVGNAHHTGQGIIPVVIDSFGGQVYAVLSMIDTMRTSTLPIATIVQGKAMSCGLILSTFGTKGLRYATPNATMMMHEVSMGTWGKIEEVKADAKEGERLNKLVYHNMAEHCGHKKDYFIELMHENKRADWYITPKLAKQHGLVDHIGSPTLVVRATVNISLE